MGSGQIPDVGELKGRLEERHRVEVAALATWEGARTGLGKAGEQAADLRRRAEDVLAAAGRAEAAALLRLVEVCGGVARLSDRLGVPQPVLRTVVARAVGTTAPVPAVVPSGPAGAASDAAPSGRGRAAQPSSVDDDAEPLGARVPEGRTVDPGSAVGLDDVG